MKRQAENDLITSFYFKRVDGENLKAHKAGQFLSIKPVKSGENIDEVRQYSLSMRPGSDFYRISIKKEEKGLISRYIHENLNVGDIVEATSPLGEFILKEGNNNRPLVLLSGGIGVTPMMSMLYKASGEGRDVTFAQAVLNSTAHTFKKELEKIKDEHSNVKSAIFYQTPLENDVKGEDYDFEGFMSKEWIESLPKNAEFYFCGPLGFMKHIYNTLTAMGVKEEDINYEMFGPAADLKDM
nr:FAD-binding oxidoreductase [uncultured Clostridium sp.]